MHEIEPFYNWRDYYIVSEDEHAPFFGKEYSEFEFTNHIYDHLIHPQWDEIGSPTLFIKILFSEYDLGFTIIEMIGEWNDCLHNDVMFLKREIVDELTAKGINKFILIGENVLNFHSSDDSYYEEWFDDIDDGWIILLNFRQHVLDEFSGAGIDFYFNSGGEFTDLNWRNFKPLHLYHFLDKLVNKRIGC